MTKDLKKVYEQVLDYFTHQTNGFAVEDIVSDRYFSFRKKGSDLKFKLNVGDHDIIYLEVIQIEINIGEKYSSFNGEKNSFYNSVAGVIEYTLNGQCENKHKVKLPYERQQLELQEIIDLVQKSIRPNAINFIMDD